MYFPRTGSTLLTFHTFQYWSPPHFCWLLSLSFALCPIPLPADTAAERTAHEWTTELPVHFLLLVMKRKFSQTKFLWCEIQKQKVRVSEKKVEKRISFTLLESLFYTLAAYFCTKGFTTCTKGENYVFKSVRSPNRSCSHSTRTLFLFLVFVVLAYLSCSVFAK